MKMIRSGACITEYIYIYIVKIVIEIFMIICIASSYLQCHSPLHHIDTPAKNQIEYLECST